MPKIQADLEVRLGRPLLHGGGRCGNFSYRQCTGVDESRDWEKVVDVVLISAKKIAEEVNLRSFK